MERTTYLLEIDTRIVIARKGSAVFCPVLLFDEIGRDGDYTQPLRYKIEVHDVLHLAGQFARGSIKPIGPSRVPKGVRDVYREVIADFQKQEA